MRLGAALVSLCITVVALAAGASSYFGLGFDAATAIMVGIAVLGALGLYHSVSKGLGLRSAVNRQLVDFSRGNTDLARQVGEMCRRLAELERRFDGALDKPRAAIDSLALEFFELRSLLQNHADTIAAHEAALNQLLQPASRQPGSMTAERHPAGSRESANAALGRAPAPTAADSEGFLARIGNIITADRIDLYLQPIVTLPQRKLHYYEAVIRLPSEPGEELPLTDLLAHAERGGLMPRLDKLAMIRCVQIVRRLLLKNREIGLFCNISGSTLNDPHCLPELLQFMDANRAIAHSIVLQFPQSALRTREARDNESLVALAERGLRFSLGGVMDLRIDPHELAIRGFRFVKVPASVLLRQAAAAGADVHPADLCRRLNGFGIDLIAENIESEGSVPDLIDFEVRFGQGSLFSPPRPVRAEAPAATVET